MAGVDWTTIVVHLIYGLPAILTVVFAYLIRRDIKPPSGGTLGEKVERIHELNIAQTTELHKLNGEPEGA